MSRQTRRLEVQTRALQTDLKDLTRKHLEAENKVEHLQTTVRGLKLDRDKRERELFLTKQTCDRAVHQKNKLQDEIRRTKDECRRLESRLHLLKDSASLHQKCRLYKAQIDDLERQLQSKEDELFDMKRTHDRRSEEVETLTRALSIKAKGLSSVCGTDVHSRLLYAISQGEEECVRLATRLRETETECRRLKEKALNDEKWRLEEEQERTSRLQSDLQMSERQRKEAERTYSELKLKYTSLEETIDERNKDLLRLQDELCSKKLELEQQYKKAYSSEKAIADALVSKEKLEKDKGRLKQTIKDQDRTLRHKGEQVRNLKRLSERREKLSKEQLANEKQRRGDAILKLREQREVNDGSSKQLSSLNEKAFELKEANKNLSFKMDSLVNEISTLREELKEKDQKNESLRKENSRLATEKEALIAAKSLLQETMLDQINSMRSRLRTQELQIKNSKDWKCDQGYQDELCKETSTDVDKISLFSLADLDLSSPTSSL